MPTPAAERLVLACQRAALLVLPSLLIGVFVLHFRGGEDFLSFKSSYSPRAPSEVVRALIGAGNHGPLIHDPHVVAYLALPLFLVCASALHALGRRARPLASLVSMAVSVTGVIYLGGLFGMWAAFYRGLGDVDPRYIDGATATFAAMSADKGAFLLTTTLSKLAFLGMALQALTLHGARRVPAWAPVAVAAGCALFLVFWDLDNWMLIGAALMLAGFVPIQRALATEATPAAVQGPAAGRAGAG